MDDFSGRMYAMITKLEETKHKNRKKTISIQIRQRSKLDICLLGIG